MSNPNTKIYLASQALQTETNNKIDTLDETVHTDIGAVQTAVENAIGDVESTVHTDISAVQTSVENAIGDVEDTVHEDITAVSTDIHENFARPSLGEIGHFKADFENDDLTVNKGALMIDDRQIIC